MRYMLSITERTPTEDGSDVNTYHQACGSLLQAADKAEDFALNFGLPVSITIVPFNG